MSIVNTSTVVGIQFSIPSPESIRRCSVVEVVSRDTYINGKPVIGGMFDPRMGTLEPGTYCPTDGLSYMESPGYFGHIELARPVFWGPYFDSVYDILKLVCFQCSRILVDKIKNKAWGALPPDKRWKRVYAMVNKLKRCGEHNDDGCGCKVPKFKKEGFGTIIAEWSKAEDDEKMSVKVTPEIALKILKRISDEDITFMGFSPIWSRPENMICQVLPVPPPYVRPSVKHDAQERSEDDLTHILIQIMKTNTSLRDKMANPAVAQTTLDEEHLALQYYTFSLVDNKMHGAQPAAQRSGRAFKSIKERILGKQGRVRGNLMGKRVNFSARSVITPDPNISIQELGVPLKIAQTITKPVRVNARNLDLVRQAVLNGPDVYPGAKIVEKGGGQIMLRYADRTAVARGLDVGDLVHRHLCDGDVVLFNRQPTLHRMSMMGHVVRIMKRGNTFRMNVGDTKPYNADFDGDEMNMHVPQDAESEQELRHLAAVRHQIISPTTNSTIIGIFQDSLVGSFLFTSENHSFTAQQAMGMCSNLKQFAAKDMKIFQGARVSSAQLLSIILPPISLHTKALAIASGAFQKGCLNKGALSARSTGLIHRIFNEYGNMAAADFIDNLQHIINEFMKSRGFSVGVSDLVIAKESKALILEEFAQRKREAESVMFSTMVGTFKNDTGESALEAFEEKMTAILASANDAMGATARKILAKNNRFAAMVSAGSKGSNLNISQMVACLGQQHVEGRRIPYGYDHRTLPHFNKYDDGPIPRGFVQSSFIGGLTPQELFFHAIAGRLGLIDTAVNTSTTGYIQRKLVKGLEDLMVSYDGTVRNSKNMIIELKYGCDNIDPCKVEETVLPLCQMGIEEIYAHYNMAGILYDDAKDGVTSTAQRAHAQLAECNKISREWTLWMVDRRAEVVEHVFAGTNDTTIRTPVAFPFVIANVVGRHNLTEQTKVDITPLETYQLLDKYYEYCSTVGKNFEPSLLFKTAYYFFFSPHELLGKYHFTKAALVFLLESVVLQYTKALISPGEMVGVIAAQSLGEPTTQLTLNTFHTTGARNKAVTLGTPRVEEILSASPNVKNPSITAILKVPTKENAHRLRPLLEETRLKDIAHSLEIHFNPVEEEAGGADKDLVQFYRDFEAMAAKAEGAVEPLVPYSPWVIRFQMDAEAMFMKSITMDDVHFALKYCYGDAVGIIYSDDNAENLLFRVRLSHELAKKKTKKALEEEDNFNKLIQFADELLDVTLRGVPGISKVLVRCMKNHVEMVGDTYQRREMFVLDTVGSNLIEVLGLPFLDATKTTSNDIKEVADVLGIDAAAACIYRELTYVLEEDGYINPRHKYLLVRRMTAGEHLCSIFRSGLNNDDTGPIAKATFEETAEMFTKAARTAECDPMRGVSANIMLGQRGFYGTSSFDVFLDPDAAPTTADPSKKRAAMPPAGAKKPAAVTVDVSNHLIEGLKSQTLPANDPYTIEL